MSLAQEDKKFIALTNNKNQKKLNQIYTSDFNLGKDEIMMRDFINSHKNVPFTKGAFSRCKKNGIITNYEMKRHNQFVASAISCVVSSASANFLFYRFLRQVGIVSKNGNILYSALSLIWGLSIGMIFSIKKYSKFIKELDIKYSAIWLKSIGKI